MSAVQPRCLLFALAERLAGGEEEYSQRADWFSDISERPVGLVAWDVRFFAAVAGPGILRQGAAERHDHTEYVPGLRSDKSGSAFRRSW